ncbi:O-antigen ligase family protein [Tessaracoccus rhinocerotis]|nr:O-antigen ligase family protein [Tessaracoccus rhinocerotis]
MTALLTSAADRGLLALAGWVGIALLTADGLRSWGDLNKAINWLVGSATVVAVVGVIQYFTGLDISGFISIPGLSAQGEFGGALSRSDLNRIVSTSAHPIELGVAMAAMLPLAIHVGFRDKTAPSWLPALAIGLASLMTVSRSAVIVAAAAMVVLILGWPARLRIMALILVPIFGVVGPVVLPGLLGTIRALFTNLGNDPSIEGRTSDYGLVTRLVLEQPFFGRGLFAWVPDVYRTLDNQVLVLLLEVGLVGALAFFIMAGAGVVQGILVRLRAKDEVQRNAGLSISASLVGISMSFVTFDALGFRQVAGLTFLLIGLGGAIKAISDKDADSPTDAV